jgi:hypothetical protein
MQVRREKRLAVVENGMARSSIAVSSSVVTRPPCTMGPDAPWKQYSTGTSHSTTENPSPCSTPR